MLIRFIAKNIYSFKEQTEFNLLPGRTQALQHHKVHKNGIDFLRFSAIYGANGAGKSNLIKAISYLQRIIIAGTIQDRVQDLKFRLDKEYEKIPLSLGIEYIMGDITFFYTVSLDDHHIVYEYLAQSTKQEDILIFERNLSENGTSNISFHPDYYKIEKDRIFVEIIGEKLIKSHQLLFSFLYTNYAQDFPLIEQAFRWFRECLITITPNSKPRGIANILDRNAHIHQFANQYISAVGTGISEIKIEKQDFEDFAGIDGDILNIDSGLLNVIENLKNNPGSITLLKRNGSDEEITLVYENEKIIAKKLITCHQNASGELIDFALSQESDGIKRLVDFIPALHGILHTNAIIIIDEIERSLHPLLIKNIIQTFALKEDLQGQLIFSTHESNLLDQTIVRPDEIWFAQKDMHGATKLYSLSDFKVHHTINIENGYMNGRFGAIPLMAGIEQLNW
jgi:AAA15 family ATPase/GTPase